MAVLGGDRFCHVVYERSRRERRGENGGEFAHGIARSAECGAAAAGPVLARLAGDDGLDLEVVGLGDGRRRKIEVVQGEVAGDAPFGKPHAEHVGGHGSTQLDIAPEVADRVRAAQAEIGKLSFGEGFAVDAAAQYRNSMAQIGRMAAQASSGAANGQPMEITNVIQLDGRVIAQSVSRTQYNQNRTVLRTNGIKK